MDTLSFPGPLPDFTARCARAVPLTPKQSTMPSALASAMDMPSALPSAMAPVFDLNARLAAASPQELRELLRESPTLLPAALPVLASRDASEVPALGVVVEAELGALPLLHRFVLSCREGDPSKDVLLGDTDVAPLLRRRPELLPSVLASCEIPRDTEALERMGAGCIGHCSDVTSALLWAYEAERATMSQVLRLGHALLAKLPLAGGKVYADVEEFAAASPLWDTATDRLREAWGVLFRPTESGGVYDVVVSSVGPKFCILSRPVGTYICYRNQWPRRWSPVVGDVVKARAYSSTTSGGARRLCMSRKKLLAVDDIVEATFVAPKRDGRAVCGALMRVRNLEGDAEVLLLPKAKCGGEGRMPFLDGTVKLSVTEWSEGVRDTVVLSQYDVLATGVPLPATVVSTGRYYCKVRLANAMCAILPAAESTRRLYRGESVVVRLYYNDDILSASMFGADGVALEK